MGIDGYFWAFGSAKRWGTNLIGGVFQGVEPPVATAIVDIGITRTAALLTDFTDKDDVVNSPYEVQSAIGDSGGALFIKQDGTWMLAGILFAVGPFGGQPASTALYGT